MFLNHHRIKINSSCLINQLMNFFTPILILLLCPTRSHSEVFYPSNVLITDDFFTHHVLVAEKMTHQLHLFENDKGLPKLVKTFSMATGKKSGDKLIEGDFKTPEGIYNFTQFLTNKQLLEQTGPQGVIYGVGAFVTDYPNPIDHRMKKGGDGIWLHSTNDETRIEKGLDSRGCVVTANNDLIDISKYLELHKTPIIIVQELVYLNEKSHQRARDSIHQTIQDWLTAWREKNIEKYMSFYDQQEFQDSRGQWPQYKAYKSSVFSMPGNPKIEADKLSIFQFKNYAVVTFRQNYQSPKINDTGKKTLYLIQNKSYEWKIVNENWTKMGLEDYERISFTPSDRFFKKNENSSENN